MKEAQARAVGSSWRYGLAVYSWGTEGKLREDETVKGNGRKEEEFPQICKTLHRGSQTDWSDVINKQEQRRETMKKNAAKQTESYTERQEG